MASIVPFDREATDESEFERRLLASARRDQGPPDVADAWARLAGALGPIVADPALGGGQSATSADGAAGLVSRTGAGAGLRAAAKWVLLGAVVGSASTAAILVGPGRRRADAPRAVVPAQAVTVVKGPAPAGLSLAAVPLAASESSAAAHASRPKHMGAAHRRGLLASAAGADGSDDAVSAGPAPASPLAAEVARLDAARTSNAVGDYDRTIELVERYHRDFPDGALAPDADVVALEAVAAKRDRAETARRAALFLSRYPGDPHAARVKWLAEH
jgi:hypothetical protein